MRCVYVDRLGSADEIRYGELPNPHPGPAEILVDVLATTVNPVDTFVRSGAFRTPTAFPLILGRDLVGTVAAIGPEVVGFRCGDLVWSNSLGHHGRQGPAAEQAVVPDDRLYRLPDDVDPESAVAVVHPGATAYLALFVHARLQSGETVFVAGAAGNVGAALTVMACEAGAYVIASAAPRDHSYCRSLGAAEVLPYDAPDLAERIRDACPRGVSVWVDTSGTNDLTTAAELLAPRGRIVLLAGVRDRAVLPVGPIFMNDASILGFVISHASVEELAAAAAGVNRLLGTGRLRPRTIERAPLSSAADAHRRMEKGELRGKRLLLLPGLDEERPGEDAAARQIG
ncbi:NADPH:quinone reductase [Streptomyces sp. Lzd4kr]|nr:NADPH:quinone reductase [Streptomyces sp. Lzd4kr]